MIIDASPNPSKKNIQCAHLDWRLRDDRVVFFGPLDLKVLPTIGVEIHVSDFVDYSNPY